MQDSGTDILYTICKYIHMYTLVGLPEDYLSSFKIYIRYTSHFYNPTEKFISTSGVLIEVSTELELCELSDNN